MSDHHRRKDTLLWELMQCLTIIGTKKMPYFVLFGAINVCLILLFSGTPQSVFYIVSKVQLLLQSPDALPMAHITLSLVLLMQMLKCNSYWLNPISGLPMDL